MRNQRGNMLVTALLALVISGLAAVALVNAKLDDQKRTAGAGEATVLLTLQGGVNTLIANAWQSFQAGGAVTYNGVTLNPAVVGGELTWEPTIAQLTTMGNLLPQGWATTTSRTNGATYRVRVARTPAGCSGAACSVEGRVWADAPFSVPGVVGSTNAKVVGAILGKLGADAGISLPGSPGTITGYGFTWATANPVSGTPAGVVMVRAGTASAAFAQFVRIGDTRDPALQGPLTVAGAGTFNSTLNATGAATFGSTVNATGVVTSNASVGAKDSASACLRAALLASGDIVSYAANCVMRFRVNPVDGSVAAKDAAGTNRVTMTGDTGALTANDSAGTATILLDGSSGRSNARMLNASVSATANASCAGYGEGDLVRDAATDGTVLSCRSGIWRRPGLQSATEGVGCAAAGMVAVDSSSRGLICRNGAWRSINDRVASVVAIATFSGNGAGSVPAPSCGSGGSPEITVTPLEAGADYGGTPPRNRFSIITAWSGSSWGISPVLVDSNGTQSSTSFAGASYNFAWLATTLCNYGVSN